MYIDIHTHSYYKKPEVTILQNLFPWQTDQLIQKQFYSVGLHPWHIENESLENNLSLVRLNAQNKNVLAIGETGLDTTIDVPYNLQKEMFSEQISIAEELGKPVIIHCVKAYNELQIFRKNSNKKIPWIIHWFGSNLQIAQQLINDNCYLSYGVNLFRENNKSFKAFYNIPFSSLFFETDDSQFSIEDVYQKAAFIRKINVSELKKHVKENFQTCFNIKI